MRANEFMIEGPGDWMDAQRLKRKQIDQAKLRKQKVPKLVKNIQQILSAYVQKLSTSGPAAETNKTDAIHELVTKVMEKATKVSMENDAFDTPLDAIIAAVQANPAGVAGNADVKNAIEEIVTASFDLETTKAQTTRPIQFQAEVYDLPVKVDGDRDMLYANADGKWSLWKKTSNNLLTFQNDIDTAEVHAVKKLITASKVEAELRTFIQRQGDYYKTSTRAPD